MSSEQCFIYIFLNYKLLCSNASQTESCLFMQFHIQVERSGAEAEALITGHLMRTHWKRPSCWERLKVGGEENGRGQDGWMASLTQWMWVWVNSRSLWWTGRPGVLRFMGSQIVGHNWATELNWILLSHKKSSLAICNNMCGYRGHCAKWNKSDRKKTNIIWFHLRMESKKQSK